MRLQLLVMLVVGGLRVARVPPLPKRHWCPFDCGRKVYPFDRLNRYEMLYICESCQHFFSKGFLIVMGCYTGKGCKKNI